MPDSLQQEQTKLETFSFGDSPEDRFYILVNLKSNPEGLNLDKLKLADPRKFDQLLTQMGCILMLSGDELNELIRRKAVNPNALHQSVYELARKEGFIS